MKILEATGYHAVTSSFILVLFEYALEHKY